MSTSLRRLKASLSLKQNILNQIDENLEIEDDNITISELEDITEDNYTDLGEEDDPTYLNITKRVNTKVKVETPSKTYILKYHRLQLKNQVLSFLREDENLFNFEVKESNPLTKERIVNKLKGSNFPYFNTLLTVSIPDDILTSKPSSIDFKLSISPDDLLYIGEYRGSLKLSYEERAPLPENTYYDDSLNWGYGSDPRLNHNKIFEILESGGELEYGAALLDITSP